MGGGDWSEGKGGLFCGKGDSEGRSRGWKVAENWQKMKVAEN